MLALLFLTAMLSGCRQIEPNDKLSVVCTIFPQYDWVRQILGEKAGDAELILLLDNKIDLHSYQPTIGDIAKISACDMFVYVGGESDNWVPGVLKEATNKNMVAVNLLEELGTAAKAEEFKEGMETGDEGEDEGAYDEHVWLSLKNAQIFCRIIAEKLSSLDSGNAEIYQKNLAEYANRLSDLDFEYQEATDGASAKVLLFGDRFPFRYLADDYSLDYYAAFVGCSAETEASFDTVIFLVEKVNELNLKNIMVTESSDKKIAEKIISESRDKNQKIIVLDAMQSVTSSDVQNKTTYLSIMENNLDALKEALG